MQSQSSNTTTPPSGVSLQATVARLLLKTLTDQCQSYCILSGYESLPDGFTSDIDFMVNAEDFARLPALMEQLATASGTCLFQSIPHEVSARAFRLAAETASGLMFFQPDSCSDYRHFGKLWLRWPEVLSARRLHPSGFWVPSAAHEFIYYLIKRVNKTKLTASQCERLSQLYAEDPRSCETLLLRFWSTLSAQRLAMMAACGDWDPLIQNMGAYHQELRATRQESPFSAALSLGKNALHALERLLLPTGGWIAIMGPDGCGKSSVLQELLPEFNPAFPTITRFHLRPKSLPARSTHQAPVTDPHGRPPRGVLLSVLKMLYLAVDYWIGYWIAVRSKTVRTGLVVFDRYFYDILVDPKRVLYGGPSWLPRMLARLIPIPDVVLLLDAAPEVLWGRKQEVPFDEVVRQHHAYRKLLKRLSVAVVIDATQPLPAVVRSVQRAMLDAFSLRARRRIKSAH